jgi:hypothetical protein
LSRRENLVFARGVCSADRPRGGAYWNVARGKTSSSAESPGKSFVEAAVPFGIVIDLEIRVFQHNPQIVAIPIPLYVASDEATYYEGAVLVVDGGRTGARQRARASAALSRIAAFERWRPGRP